MEKRCFHPKMHVNGFWFTTMRCFLIHNNKIGICIKVHVKKVYQWLQNKKMAQFWGKAELAAAYFSGKEIVRL